MENKEISFGPVKIIKGRFSGRIGFYDNDDDEDDKAIVYFGNPANTFRDYSIPFAYLADITTDDLMRRREEIGSSFFENLSETKRLDLMSEYNFVSGLLSNRLMQARFTEIKKGKSIFLSHSSIDRQFAKWLAIDLSTVGHNPWLDEWEIRAGESMPTKIAEGVEKCDFVAVILSEHAVQSNWVEREWHAKYWDEINKGQILVIPILYKECKIPPLLKMKKYANFTLSYNNGFEELLMALRYNDRTKT